MRFPLWVIFSTLAGALLVPGSANAQTKDDRVGLGRDGLTGIERVGVPVTATTGVGLTGTAGYGYTEEVLNQNDSHHRMLGVASLSARPFRWLGVAAQLDGRADFHSTSTGKDSGLVGDPRFLLRGSWDFTKELSLGMQATLWFPGANAPSIVPEATSADFVAQGSYSFGALTVALNSGFRLNNSAKTEDNPDQLSLSDRLSLGVSDSHAVLFGLGASYKIGQWEILGEWTWDLLFGSNAPSAIESPMRIDAGARWTPFEDYPLALRLLAEFSPSSRPTIAAASPLVPVEPRIGALLGLSYFFSFEERKTIAEKDSVEPERQIKEEKIKEQKPVPTTGNLRIAVVDTESNPMSVTIVLKDEQGQLLAEVSTDDAGIAQVEKLKPGTLNLEIEAEGFEPYRKSETIKVGENQRNVTLQAALPVGQIRGLVRSFSGKALRAKIIVEPGGVEVVADSDGVFEVDVAPGAYEVTISADRHSDQTRKVTVEEQGVTVLNIDMRPDRKPRGKR